MRIYPKHIELAIVTSNMLHRQPVKNALEDALYIADSMAPDVWGCQESEGYRTVLSQIPNYGYMAVKNPSKSELQDPVLYNKSTMAPVSYKTHKMIKGKAGAYPDRYTNEAHLITKQDGMHVWYFNTHSNHHVEVGGLPRPEMNARVKTATEHFRKMAALVQARAKGGNSVVFWGGDLNVDVNNDLKENWHGFPHYIFSRHNMISVFEELKVNWSGRVLDWIGSCNEDKDVKALSVTRSPDSVHSDHRFVKAVYSIPRTKTSAGGKPPTTAPQDPDQYPWIDPVTGDTIDEFIPQPATPLPPAQPQIVGTWDHSVCCRKNG